MAAGLDIVRITGTTGSPTATVITSINTRANAEDNHTTAGMRNSVLIPASGSNNSFTVSTQLKINSITAGTVNNLRWYTTGSNNLGTGGTAIAQNATSYTQATGVTGTSGDILNTSNYSTLTGAPSDPFAWTSGSPKTLTGTTTTTGQFGDIMAYQIAIASTSS